MSRTSVKYLKEYDCKYNTREPSDVERTEAAIENMEGLRLTLFKSVSGGPSLLDRKPDYKPPKG